MNELFTATSLNDKDFGTGVELKGFGVLTTEYSEQHKKETGLESETYLYTEFNGIVKVDKNSVVQHKGIFREEE